MSNKSLLSAPHLPLFDFFQAIRQWEATDLSRQALTSREYEWAITALDDCPFELKTKDDYYHLCKLLWFKPYHAEKDANTEGVVDAQFRTHFDTFWTDLERHIQTKTAENPLETPPIEAMSRVLDPNIITPPIEIDKPNTTTTTSTTTQTTIKNDTALSNVWVSNQDVEVTKANSEKAAQWVSTARRFGFLEKNKFLPLEIRRLYQLLMSVRQVTFDGARNIPDFEATIKDFARQGYIKDFNFRRQARLQMGVHVLIDHEGSMMAFEHMSDIIAEFVQFVGNKNSTIWYFHNCPTAYIFQDKNHFEAVRTTDWLKMLDEKAPAQVFIFSDAGAARGYKNMERIVATEAFLKNLKKHTFVWLNPMPEKRWKDTAAEDIRRKVRMYDASDREFVTAMQSLKMQ